MPDNELQFERAFGELAFAAVRDAIPILMRYMIGFQLVEKSEDDTSAIGVFGFDVNGTNFQIPIFFLNGKIKGKEGAYVADQDLFVPLTEEWVTYYINKKPEELGELIEKIKRPRYHKIDLTSFTESPLGAGIGKQSSMCEFDGDRKSLNGKLLFGKPFDISPVLEASLRPVDSEGFSKAAEMFDLNNIVKKNGVGILNKVASLMRADPRIKDAISRFYDGPTLLKNAGIKSEPPKGVIKPYPDSYLHKNGFTRGLWNHYIDKYASESQLPYNDTTRKFLGMTKLQSLTPETARDNLELLKLPPLPKKAADNGNVEFYRYDTGYTQGLSDDDKERLFNKGWFVKDARAKTSDVFSSGAVDNIVNPSSSCRFNVLKGGKLKKALVFDTGGNWYVVYKDGDIERYDDNKKIFGYFDLLSTTDLEKFPKAKKLAGSKNTGNPEGCGYPFQYLLIHGGRTLEVHGVTDEGDGVFSASLGPDYKPVSIILQKEAKSIQIYNAVIILPHEARIVDISKARYTTAPTASSYDIIKGARLTPAVLYKKGDRYFTSINGDKRQGLSEVDMASYLVVEQGISKEAADIVLDSIGETPKPFFIKYAADVETNEEGTLFDDVAEIHQEEDEVEPAEVQDRSRIHDMYQASQKGEKEILDLAMLPTLVKKMHIDDDISEWLKNILIGMDRTGRMLFMFYWHNDKFVDKHGDGEMDELEDMLRNVFRSTGDMVLFLLQKEVDETLGLTSSVPELG